MSKRLLTPREAADILRVHPRTVQRWANDGEIPGAMRLKGRLRIPREALDGLLEPVIPNPYYRPPAR